MKLAQNLAQTGKVLCVCQSRMARYRFCSFHFAPDRLWKTLDFRPEPAILTP